jgi:hypothetical protein
MTHQFKSCIEICAVVALVAASASAPASAQSGVLADPPNLSSGGGAAATSSYSPSNIEAVNAVNGNTILSIPLARLAPGPAGFSAGVGLVYNSTMFDERLKSPPRSRACCECPMSRRHMAEGGTTATSTHCGRRPVFRSSIPQPAALLILRKPPIGTRPF